MFTKIYWIHQFDIDARLGIMARPRGNDWLENEIIQLKKQHVSTLVSLLESDEIYELGLKQENVLCEKHGIKYINFPIPDRDVPKYENDVNVLISQLIKSLDAGSIVVHCRMGIGRSSIIAGALLLAAGIKFGNIFDSISTVRGMKVPDTDKQSDWLKARV